MPKNYAHESGSFMMLSRLMRDDVRRLLAAESEGEKEYLIKCLTDMANQVDQTLEQFGYSQAK